MWSGVFTKVQIPNYLYNKMHNGEEMLKDEVRTLTYRNSIWHNHLGKIR